MALCFEIHTFLKKGKRKALQNINWFILKGPWNDFDGHILKQQIRRDGLFEYVSQIYKLCVDSIIYNF